VKRKIHEGSIPHAILLESKPSSEKYQKLSNTFGNPTGTSSSSSCSSSSTSTPGTEKKKKRDADDVDGRLYDSILEDAKKEEERDTALFDLIERNNQANKDALRVLTESAAAANKLLADTLAAVVQAANKKK
jgi:hypothetical protein